MRWKRNAGGVQDIFRTLLSTKISSNDQVSSQDQVSSDRANTKQSTTRIAQERVFDAVRKIWPNSDLGLMTFNIWDEPFWRQVCK